MKKGKDTFYAKYIKRILDFLLAVVFLMVLSPLFLALTVIGAIVMKGNPFFVQARPGKIDPKTGKEKIFKMIKFRTMTDERDKNGDLLPDAQRLNTYGRFLRSTSLDDTLGLLSVVCGHMSLVGPRPLLVSYLDRYTKEQHRRHEIRPGISGYAQVYGRNAISWDKKFKYDVYYVDNVSFMLDVKILFNTVKVVFTRTGISSATSETMEEFMGTPKGVEVK